MEYLLKASAVIALFYLCFFILLKKETFFQHNRWFLLIGLVIALLFPLIVIPVYIPSELVIIQETAFIPSTPSNFVVTHPEAEFDWYQLIPIVYGIGLAVFLIQFIVQFSSLILLLGKNQKQKEQQYTYVIVDNKISPFSFFKWIVYNPESYKAQDLQLILTHEKVHASQLHSIDILFTQMACIVFWFNPLIWLYRKEVRQNLEYIADSKTQVLTKTKKEYQHLLLKTGVANHSILLSNNFYNSSIKKRILMLNKSRSNKKNLWKYTLMLPILAGLLMSMNRETVYIETEIDTQINNNTIENLHTITEIKDSVTNDSFKVKFTKNMTNKGFDKMKTWLKSKNVMMTIKRLKRNNKNEISNINIDFKAENGKTNYNAKDKNGIKPFEFRMDDNGSFGVEVIQNDDHVKGAYIIEESSKKNRFKNYSYDYDSLDIKKQDSTYFNSPISKHNTLSNDLKIIKESKDTIYTITMDSLEIERLTNEKSDFYYEDGTKPKTIDKEITIHQSITQKSYYNTKQNYFKTPEPLIIANGKLVTSEYLKSINPNDIESMTVLKGKNAIKTYGEKGENGVIIITTKQLKNTQNTSTNENQTPNEDKYLYILDGKEISKSELKKVYSLETVSSLKVLKEKEAKKKYGDKGKHGVVEVISKNSNNSSNRKTYNFTSEQEASKKDNPWKVRTEVNRLRFTDDEDPSKNANIAYISKFTSDQALEDHKVNLKAVGITVNYSKLKRNKAGEITSIKINLKDKENRKSSATWNVNEGIPNIEFGIYENTLIARTKQ